MTFAIIVLCVLCVFVIVLKKLEDRIGSFHSVVESVRRWQRHTHDRISSLEVKDFSQDFRLDDHEKAIGQLNKGVNELERDIGWDDDYHRTEEIKPKDPDDVE